MFKDPLTLALSKMPSLETNNHRLIHFLGRTNVFEWASSWVTTWTSDAAPSFNLVV
jgi:hypothetical protein